MSMPTKLQQYFPMIRNKHDILKEIDSNVKLTEKFYSLKEHQRQEFLDFCSGARGVKMLYDSFFKEITHLTFSVRMYKIKVSRTNWTFIYEHVYNICRNVEELMGIFSEELKILDRNTVKYMVDQMQETINEQKAQIAQQKNQLAEKDHQMQKLSADITMLKEQLQLLQAKNL